MKIMKWTSLLMVFGLLASCYPEKDRTIDDFDIVGTNYDDSKNWDDYKTFYVHDSILLVYDTTEDVPEYPNEAATVILDGIQKNLIAYGWVEITDTTGGIIPDVYITPYVWTSDVSGAIYYPGYPWYGGGYYPGYPGYYPGYPGWGGATYYSYTTGTILIDMLDLVHPDTINDQLDILWSAGINGIVSSGSSLTRIKFSVDQAFSQSKYLKKN